MFDVAPASVLLMGLIGLLVIAFAIARMAVLEHQVHQSRAVRRPLVPTDAIYGSRTAA